MNIQQKALELLKYHELGILIHKEEYAQVIRELMTYDPIRWCTHGQHPAKRDTFVPLPGKIKRAVCGACWERIQTAERLIKQRGA